MAKSSSRSTNTGKITNISANAANKLFPPTLRLTNITAPNGRKGVTDWFIAAFGVTAKQMGRGLYTTRDGDFILNKDMSNYLTAQSADKSKMPETGKGVRILQNGNDYAGISTKYYNKITKAYGKNVEFRFNPGNGGAGSMDQIGFYKGGKLMGVVMPMRLIENPLRPVEPAF